MHIEDLLNHPWVWKILFPTGAQLNEGKYVEFLKHLEEYSDHQHAQMYKLMSCSMHVKDPFWGFEKEEAYDATKGLIFCPYSSRTFSIGSQKPFPCCVPVHPPFW